MMTPHLLTPLGVLILLPFLSFLLWRRTAHATHQITGKSWLAYSPAQKRLALLLCAPVLLLSLLAFALDAQAQEGLLWACAIFGLLVAYLTVEFFGVSIAYDDEHLYCFSPWRGNRIIPWQTLNGCRYSEAARCLVLDSRDQGKILIPLALEGRSAFLQSMSEIVDRFTSPI